MRRSTSRRSPLRRDRGDRDLHPGVGRIAELVSRSARLRAPLCVVQQNGHRAPFDHRAECLDDCGTMMLFYLASLQAISTDVYEAAAIDGAGAWRTFWKITFPLLKPGHFFVAVVSIIGALQQFDQSFIVGGSGGPNYSTMRSCSISTTGRQCALRLRRCGRPRPLRLHLHGYLDPAAPVREGRGGLMADDARPRLRLAAGRGRGH